VIGTVALDGWLLERAAGSFLGTAAPTACRRRAVRRARRADGAGRGARRAQAVGLYRRQAAGRAERARSLLTTDLLTWRGKLELLREPLRPGRDADSGDESMHAFATRRLGRRGRPGPGRAGGDRHLRHADAHEVSLRGRLPALAALDAEHGGLVRGALHAALGRRRARGTEPSRPRGLRAPEAGMGAVVAAVAAARRAAAARRRRRATCGCSTRRRGGDRHRQRELRADACVLARAGPRSAPR
jgi:hypothetical protein